MHRRVIEHQDVEEHYLSSYILYFVFLWGCFFQKHQHGAKDETFLL